LENIVKFEIIYVPSSVNLGFAEGNNLAEKYSKGEFLALLNIDAKADEDWLRQLIESIRYDSSAAAVTSKILFWERFEDIYLSSTSAFLLT